MNWKILLGIGAVTLLAVAPTSSARSEAPRTERRQRKREGRQGARVAHGVTVVNGQLRLVDWGAWMDWAPPAIQRVRGYGAESGEQIAVYLFHQLFPLRQWPPAPYDPMLPTWDSIVEDIVALLPLLEAEEKKTQHVDDNVILLRRD